MVRTVYNNFFRIVHSREFNDLGALSVPAPPGPSPPHFPWEVYSNGRSVSGLREEEYRRGRALILYPDGYAPLLNETEYFYDSTGRKKVID